MLLVIDVGNTNTVLGVIDGKKIVKDWRISTIRNSTADEFSVLILSLFKNGEIDLKKIKKTIISCVVPPVLGTLDSFCKKYIGHKPHFVDAKSVKGFLPILLNNPDEIGADRIVNGVAAYEKYQTALIIIDFGTATTFDVISQKGEYLGGTITPGIVISAEALFQKASKLPRVDLLTPPEKVIGKDTGNSIKSGIIYGYAGLVDGMVKRISSELGTKPKVLATGGLAPLISKVSDSIESVESSLTLEGLRIISEKI